MGHTQIILVTREVFLKITFDGVEIGKSCVEHETNLIERLLGVKSTSQHVRQKLFWVERLTLPTYVRMVLLVIETRNILKVYRAATADQHAAGMSWYGEAHDLALSLSPDDVWRAAGVIAAYSPLTPWWRNIELATDSLTTGVARTDSLGNSVRAASRILSGEHALDVLKGDKTRAFCSNIALNGECDHVTVDVHAYSVAVGTPVPSSQMKTISKNRYRELSEAYRRAAKRAKIHPTQMQAVTWVVWRDRHYKSSARKEAS